MKLTNNTSIRDMDIRTMLFAGIIENSGGSFCPKPPSEIAADASAFSVEAVKIDDSRAVLIVHNGEFNLFVLVSHDDDRRIITVHDVADGEIGGKPESFLKFGLPVETSRRVALNALMHSVVEMIGYDASDEEQTAAATKASREINELIEKYGTANEATPA